MHQAQIALATRGRLKLDGFLWSTLGLSLAALLVPVLVAGVPPLVDYPNHLARIWLLGGGAAQPPVSAMYRVTFDTLTNIGIDLVAVVLSHVASFEEVGRIFVAAAVLLPPLGGVVLWRVIHGRFAWWQVAFSLLAWSMGLIGGFLNFEIGLGLAMLAAALDPVLQRRGALARAAGHAALGGLLLLVHVFALVFYAALLCAITVGPLFEGLTRRARLFGLARSLLTLLATLALPMVLFALVAPSLPGKQVGASLQSVWADFNTGFADVHHPAAKLQGAFSGIQAYDRWLDVLTLVALLTPVAVSLAMRRLVVHAGLLIVAAALLAGYFVVPESLAGTFWIDRRFALMAAFALAVAVRPELPRIPARVLTASLLLVSLIRTSAIGSIWLSRQNDVAAVARALDRVPPGAAILPLAHHVVDWRRAPAGRYSTVGLPSFRHLPMLALPWRRAFVPILFAARGKQPVAVLSPWDEIASPEGGSIASVHALDTPEVYAADLQDAPYLANWRARFDYALVVNADMPDVGGPFAPPADMALVADEGFAQLYRLPRSVDHGGSK